MANSTSPYLSLTPRFWGYVIQGTTLFFTNGVIFITIIYHELLRSRKEYALPALLAFTDALHGLCGAMAGLGRNVLIFQNKAHVPITLLECFKAPWTLPYVFASYVNDPLLLMISVDRLIAIGWPLFHFGLPRSYSLIMVLVTMCPTVWGYIHLIVRAMQNPQVEVVSLCVAPHLYSPEYNSYLYLYRFVVSSSSVLLYIPVTVLYLQHNSAMITAHTSATEVKKYVESQRKFTITMGISCFFTTIFYIGPTIFRLVMVETESIHSPWVVTMLTSSYVIEGCNRLANVFLYSLRHKNLRLGIKFLFKRKQLTLQALQLQNNVVIPLQHIQATPKPAVEVKPNIQIPRDDGTPLGMRKVPRPPPPRHRVQVV